MNNKVLNNSSRLAVLDGWRGLSILLVLASHLIPLGPKSWRLNEAAGIYGMALFFILSGFLITRLLLADQHIFSFLTKRFLRIIPLAWVAMIMVLISLDATLRVYLSHLFFYANLPTIDLTAGTAHLWSLCVEMQFYCGIALLVGFFGRSSLRTLPLFCLFVTAYRCWAGSYVDIVTIGRIDEILAGCTLALVYSRQMGESPVNLLSKINPLFLIIPLALASHPYGEWLNFFRPYFAAMLIGSCLFNCPKKLQHVLNSRFLIYVATISYALYVLHGVLGDTWLGSGEKFEKYLKRPLLLAASFTLAHLSTFYFEAYFIKYGKHISQRFKRPIDVPS